MRFLGPALIIAMHSLCFVCAQEYLGVTITKPEVPIHISREKLLTGKNVGEPQEDTNWIDGYTLSHIVTFDDYFSDFEEDIKVEVWTKVLQMYPGWNSPIAIVKKQGEVIKINELKEIGMPSTIWAANHFSDCYVYIENIHRHRSANSTFIYKLSTKNGELEFTGVFYAQDDLENEARETAEIN